MTGQKQRQAVQVTLDREMLRELERRAEAAGISTREMVRLLLTGELAKRPSWVTLHSNDGALPWAAGCLGKVSRGPLRERFLQWQGY